MRKNDLIYSIVKNLVGKFNFSCLHRCVLCGDSVHNNKDCICANCINELPKTNFHLSRDNPVASVFYGRVNIYAATSYFYFVKSGKYSDILYKFKYLGYRYIGYCLGKSFGNDLALSPLFRGVDVIVPVPLHKKKKRLRGYNQSEYIAAGLAESMAKPLSKDNLVRKEFTVTQTTKSRVNRLDNVRGAFKVVNPNKFADKHILLVDDVITTGATMEACAEELLKIEGTMVSVASLAKAGY